MNNLFLNFFQDPEHFVPWAFVIIGIFVSIGYIVYMNIEGNKQGKLLNEFFGLTEDKDQWSLARKISWFKSKFAVESKDDEKEEAQNFSLFNLVQQLNRRSIQVSSLNERLESLKSDFDDLQEKNETLRTEINNLGSENARLELDSKNEMQALVKLTGLVYEHFLQAQDLENLSNDKIQYQAEGFNTAQSLLICLEDLQGLRNKRLSFGSIEDVNLENKNLYEQIDAHQKKENELRSTITMRDMEYNTLDRKYKLLEEEKEKIEYQFKDYKKLKQDLFNQKEKDISIKHDLIEHIEKKLVESEKNIKKLRSFNLDLQSMLRDSEISYSNVKSEHNELLSSLSEFKKQCEELRRSKEESDAEVDKYLSELEHVRKDLSKTEQEKQRLHRNLNENHASYQDIVVNLEKTKKINNDLLADLENTKSKIAFYSYTEKELSDWSSRYETLRESYNLVNNQIVEYEQDVQKQKEKLASYESQNTEFSSEMRRMKSDLQALRTYCAMPKSNVVGNVSYTLETDPPGVREGMLAAKNYWYKVVSDLKGSGREDLVDGLRLEEVASIFSVYFEALSDYSKLDIWTKYLTQKQIMDQIQTIFRAEKILQTYFPYYHSKLGMLQYVITGAANSIRNLLLALNVEISDIKLLDPLSNGVETKAIQQDFLPKVTEISMAVKQLINEGRREFVIDLETVGLKLGSIVIPSVAITENARDWI